MCQGRSPCVRRSMRTSAPRNIVESRLCFVQVGFGRARDSDLHRAQKRPKLHIQLLQGLGVEAFERIREHASSRLGSVLDQSFARSREIETHHPLISIISLSLQMLALGQLFDQVADRRLAQGQPRTPVQSLEGRARDAVPTAPIAEHRSRRPICAPCRNGLSPPEKLPETYPAPQGPSPSFPRVKRSCESRTPGFACSLVYSSRRYFFGSSQIDQATGNFRHDPASNVRMAGSCVGHEDATIARAF